MNNKAHILDVHLPFKDQHSFFLDIFCGWRQAFVSGLHAPRSVLTLCLVSCKF